MSEEWYIKWFKHRASKAPVERPSPESWFKIDSKIGDWLAFWYTSNKNESGPLPSDSVWNALNAQLEIQSVQKRTKRMYWVRSVAATLLLLVVPTLIHDSFYTAQFQSSQAKSNTQKASGNSSQFSSTDNPNLTLNADSENKIGGLEMHQTSVQTLEGLPATVSTIALSKNEQSTDEFLTHTVPQIPSDAMEIENLLASHLPQKPIVRLDDHLSADLKEASYRDPLETNKWKIGVAVNCQSSNLLNPINQLGMKSSSQITLLWNQNFSYEFSVSRRLRNNALIDATIVFNDKKYQFYKDFVGPDYIEKSTVLTYQSLSIDYHHPIFQGLLTQNFGLELNGGVFGSYRTRIEEKWGDQDRYDLRDGFRNYNIGLSLGLNGIFHLTPKVDVITGLYNRNGILNIFKGTETIPANFYKTYTSSFGLKIGMKYQL